jgi:endoglucanase
MGLQPGDFGIWDLPNFELNDGFIYARVMDDLVGCTASLLTLWKLVQEKAEADVYGVFTRAEEVGLVGAELLLRSRRLPENCFVISLEASKTLPGAIQGEGPVIRVGDRGFTFSETAEFALKAAADKMGSDIMKVRKPLVKIQRQLMSGGRCEASAAVMNGYAATGLAFALGNYHNMATDFTLQMENIHEADFVTGVELLYETARLMPQYEALLAGQHAAETSQHANRLLQTADYIKSVSGEV